MRGADFVTYGEESLDGEDLFETMVDSDMLGRDELAQKANIDPEARKSKDVAKLLGAIKDSPILVDSISKLKNKHVKWKLFPAKMCSVKWKLFLQLLLHIVFHLSQSWFCACTWYRLVAGVLFWYHLMSLVSDSNTVESELVLCLHLISPCSWGIVLIPACYLWYVLSDADFGLNTLDFDISLLSLVSDTNTVESELVLCSHMISMFIYHYSISSFFTFLIGTTHTLLSVMKEHVLHG